MTPTLTPVAQAAAHAFLAPSSAFRWRRCSASAWMESQFPDLSDAVAAREGEAAHWVMLHRLTMPAAQYLAVGSTAPNGVEVTQAMVDGVEMLARDIESRLGPEWRSLIVVEKPVSIPRVHPQNWGTPDVRAYVRLPNGRICVYIWDFKFGFKRVEVFENDQLVDYAAGCLTEVNQIGGAAHRETNVDVVLVVVQPRAYHGDGPVRDWRTTAVALREQIHVLNMAADEATGVAPVCRPQPEACENCRARSGCDALQEAVYRGMEIARTPVPRELSDAALGLELATFVDVEALIKARVSGLEELVKARLSQGKSIPHWAYGPGQGSTHWTKPAAEVIALGKTLGFDLAKPADVITPLQARDRGLPLDYVKPYFQTVSGAVKLQRSTDATARKVFSIVNA